MKIKNLVFALLISICAVINAQSREAKFIWAHNNLDVRNEYVYFRNEFDLREIADDAQFNIYVDSRYQLYINEIYVNFGPARSYPANPEFDFYDITKYLKAGRNVISVKALYNGIENFQVPDNRPGFIAWGKIKEIENVIDLSTPGNWICKRSTGYDQNAVRFSFATAAMEVYDAQKEDYNWVKIALDVSEWDKPIIVGEQGVWGTFTPRSIPQLTKNEYLFKNVVSAYELSDDEDIYQFRIKTPDEKREDYYPSRHLIGYTYIYSPIAQEVEAGLWWGEFYLNGEGPLKGLGEKSPKINRDPRILKLKQGWNFFNMHYGAIWGAWDFYMALPKSAGLVLSPTKELNSDAAFMTAGKSDQLNNELKMFRKPFNSDKEMKELLDIEWTEQSKTQRTNNPALDMVWRLPSNKVNISDWKVSDINIQKETSITFDAGKKTLGRIFIEFEAPAGTVLDLGISEDLTGDRAWLFKRKMISAGIRFVADGKKTRFETFKPYGFRYVQLNVTGQSSEVKIKRIGAIEQIYPFEKIGSFECSDPMFNSIWELGWRTLRVCAEDSYTDTPFRERGLYAGDMLPEYAITLAGSGDSRLLRRSLKYFHDQYKEEMFNNASNRHEDFPLINIVSSKWYYDYTKDKTLVEFVYDGYKSLLKKWYDTADENGIMFTGPKFIEWTKIDKNASLTASHALVSYCSVILAEYAKILGKENDLKFFNSKAKEIREIVSEKFWDEQKSLFNDGFKEGVLEGSYYPTSNAWPLLYGCADTLQTKRILEYLRKELQDIGEESRNRRITPYSSFYALAALYNNGRADIAERFIRQYWTRMILNGNDTSWENFDIGGENGGGQGTASHAWSGHPTYFLTSEVLGVNLGFHKQIYQDKILIAPQTETITWARGTVPHPAGNIKVDWHVEGNKLYVNYETESNIKVEVKPKGKLADYKLFINTEK